MSRKYRVLQGSHIGRDAAGKEKYFSQGDIVETDDDLLAFNGRGGHSPKFALVAETEPITEEALQRRLDETQRKLDEVRKAKSVVPEED